MQTEREYAISLGLAKPTRGRMSRVAHAAIADARAQGMTFSDAVAVRKITSSVNANPLPAAPEDRPEAFDPYMPTPDTLRSGYLRFVKPNGGSLQVNATEACQNCKSSFSFCHCEKPTFMFWRTGEVYRLDA